VLRPQVALDLHYMLTFYGDDTVLTSHRLLGSVVRTLHAYPILTRQRIRDAIISANNDNGANFSFLSESNLADDVELVKFSPLHLSLEELSKIWSVFFQVPYVLSIAYQGTVVLIENDDTPQPSLPVQRRGLSVMPFRYPIVDQIVSTVNQPIIATSSILIKGQQLSGPSTTLVRINGTDITPQTVSDTQLVVLLADVTNLRAGVQGLQVVQPLAMGVPPVPHPYVESNIAAFVVRPTINVLGLGQYDIAYKQKASSSVPPKDTITVTITPAISRTQRVALLLNEVVTPQSPAPSNPPVRSRAYSFRADAKLQTWQTNQETGEELTNAVVFEVSDIQNGTYAVRVQVDGAESLLNVDTNPTSATFNTFSGSPQLVIPPKAANQ
jgi:hypothetical protein